MEKMRTLVLFSLFCDSVYLSDPDVLFPLSYYKPRLSFKWNHLHDMLFNSHFQKTSSCTCDSQQPPYYENRATPANFNRSHLEWFSCLNNLHLSFSAVPLTVQSWMCVSLCLSFTHTHYIHFHYLESPSSVWGEREKKLIKHLRLFKCQSQEKRGRM